MINKIYSVYDNTAEAFMPPFYIQNDNMALRAIDDCLSDPQHMFSQHPKDFELYYLGEFDNIEGKFTLTDSPKHIRSLHLMVKEINTTVPESE